MKKDTVHLQGLCPVFFYKTDLAKMEATSSTWRSSVVLTVPLEELKLIIQYEHDVASFGALVSPICSSRFSARCLPSGSSYHILPPPMPQHKALSLFFCISINLIPGIEVNISRGALYSP